MTSTIPSSRNCSDCSKPITKQSKSGRCRLCALARANADPRSRERKSAAVRRRLADPSERSKVVEQIVSAGREARRDPAFRAKMSEIGRQSIRAAFTPAARAKWKAGRAQAYRKRTETMIGWCPPQYRAEYARVRRQGNHNAASARLVIEAKMRAEMTTFERQMEAVRRGAGIVTVQPTRRREPDFTLGGVTAW